MLLSFSQKVIAFEFALRRKKLQPIFCLNKIALPILIHVPQGGFLLFEQHESCFHKLVYFLLDVAKGRFIPALDTVASSFQFAVIGNITVFAFIDHFPGNHPSEIRFPR